MTRSGDFVERHPGFGVLVVGLGTLVVPFDSSVNVAFPHIIRGFDLAIPSIQWVVITYTLTYAALTLVFGRVGDILGYQRIFQLGNVSGVVAFILCAAAPTCKASEQRSHSVADRRWRRACILKISEPGSSVFTP